jgi:hypothetical protein
MSGENGILGLNNSTGHLRGRVHCRFQLALLSIVNRQLSHKPKSVSLPKAMEDENTLKASVLVSQL